LGWTCSICGEYHEDDLLDIRMTLPEPVFRLSEPERGERAELGDDWCRLREAEGAWRHYTRGILEIPIHESDRYFGYGVWVELAAPDFYRIGELWSDPAGAQVPAFSGELANELTPYTETEGLSAAIKLRDVNLLPTVHLGHADHALVSDQRQGITLDRARTLAEASLH
jgi:hypothetical protein